MRCPVLVRLRAAAHQNWCRMIRQPLAGCSIRLRRWSPRCWYVGKPPRALRSGLHVRAPALPPVGRWEKGAPVLPEERARMKPSVPFSGHCVLTIKKAFDALLSFYVKCRQRLSARTFIRALSPDVFARRRSSALAPDQHRAWAPCTRWRTPSTSHIPCPTSVVCPAAHS